jgi:hypothetical protein
MTELARLEQERLRPTPRLPQPPAVPGDLGDLIHLIVTGCLQHDTEGRAPRYFNEGDDPYDWPGYLSRYHR